MYFSANVEEEKEVSPIFSNLSNFSWENEDVMQLLQEMPNETDEEFIHTEKISKPKKIKLNGPDLAVALDRAQVSIADGARVVAAVAQCLGQNIDGMSLSASTLHRNRNTNRIKLGSLITNTFSVRPGEQLFVRWDGKLMQDLKDSNKKVERVAVVVRRKKMNELLGVKVVENSTGEEQATAVMQLLRERNLTEYVCGLVFDTTASNTGRKIGACLLLEKYLGRSLLNLACRHHVYELVLRAAYEAAFAGTSSPDVPVFNRFKAEWCNIDASDFKTCFDDPQTDSQILHLLQEHKEDILSFAQKRLKVSTRILVPLRPNIQKYVKCKYINN